MKITLAKALVVKKRLAERIAQLTKEITDNNVISVMHPYDQQPPQIQPKVDVKLVQKERSNLIDAMIKVKTAINAANNGEQYNRILQLAELKGEITMLKGLSVAEGTTLDRYSGEARLATTTKPIISKKEVDQNVTELQRILDTTQEAVEKFNWRTEIEVPDVRL
jgi:hypothetical protein